MSAVSEFLARFPPFDALPAGDLGSIASRVEVRRYGLGENILVEDGEPAHHLYVVVEGSVELSIRRRSSRSWSPVSASAIRRC